MSRQLGLDLSPYAFRANLMTGVENVQTFESVYLPKGCRRSDEYDSADRWDDPMAFRGRTLGENYEGKGIEKTVDYLLPRNDKRECLECYRRKIAGAIGTMHDVRIIGTLPDHATPDEKDDVLRGLGAGAILLWRSVAVALSWLKDNRHLGDKLLNRKLLVLDLDGGRPEVTEFDLDKHEKTGRESDEDDVVPVRSQPKRGQILKGNQFTELCYQWTLNGIDESEQLMGGQFGADVQKALESDSDVFDAWLRSDGAWRQEKIKFATEMPEQAIAVIETLFKRIPRDDDRIVLCVGWFARRYADQFAAAMKQRLGGDVFIMDAESVALGAAEFGRRLEAKLPTYYDRLPCYRWWDGKCAEWKELFGQYQRVEPGETYSFPNGGKDCILKIPKYNDNVSMYVQVKTEDDKYEEGEVFAHRLKLNFAEYLKKDIFVKLTSKINPQEGSASFTITAVNGEEIFQIGQNRSRSATLKYSEDPDANRYSSVQLVKEHEGYLEPQPVLGRIFDSADNRRMVELACTEEGVHSDEFGTLKQAYYRRYPVTKYNPETQCSETVPEAKRLITERVGYDAVPKEPTRGMFGTRRIPDTCIDSMSHRFAEWVRQRRHWVGGSDEDNSEAMKRNNYLHAWASDDYKNFIRQKMRAGWLPSHLAFNFCNAPGYVLGDESDDVNLLLRYIRAKHNENGQIRAMLWWSFFRMLCWHQEINPANISVNLLSACMDFLIEDMPVVPDSERKYLVLSVLYALRIRACVGRDLDDDLRKRLIQMLSAPDLISLDFPKTMINNINGARKQNGDTLSKYVIRFLERKDKLYDRELGAAMGGV